MMTCYKAGLLTALFAILVAALPRIEERANICSSGIYGELVPVLASYPVAQSFCTQIFPVKCTTKRAKQRAAPSTTKRRTPMTTSSSSDRRAPAWAKCQKQPKNVVSTLCSCIQTPKVCILGTGIGVIAKYFLALLHHFNKDYSKSSSLMALDYPS